MVQTTIISDLFKWSPCPQPCQGRLLKSDHVITLIKSFPSLPISLQVKSKESLHACEALQGPALQLL